MKKVIALASATALTAALTLPAAANNVPLNTVSGGEGQEIVVGDGHASGVIPAMAVLGIVGIAVLIGSGSSSSSTP